MNRAARQVERLAEQFAFQHSLRAIEAVHAQIHGELLEWARWGKERFPGCPLEYQAPSIWDLPAKTPDWYEATPEAIEPPLDEKLSVRIDAKISHQDFPAVWRKLLKVNYIWRPVEWDRPLVARISQQGYLDQLHRALEALG